MTLRYFESKVNNFLCLPTHFIQTPSENKQDEIGKVLNPGFGYYSSVGNIQKSWIKRILVF